MEHVYKLWHQGDDTYDVYIASSLLCGFLSDIIVGLQFFVESESQFGQNYDLPAWWIAYFLQRCFGCRAVDRSEAVSLELSSMREQRCGSGYESYIDLVRPYASDVFVQCLFRFYDDPAVFSGASSFDVLSPEQLMQKYDIHI